MGGGGSQSGLGHSNKYLYSKMVLSGKTGTEKQRDYAQLLADSTYRTAVANGNEGMYKTDTEIDRYVSKETAELSNATYRFISEAVKKRKTYGEVIDFLRSYGGSNFFSMQEMIQSQAKKTGQTPTQFVDYYLSKSK